MPTETSRDPSDETALWAAMIERRDIPSRNRLVEFYLPLCRTIAAMLYANRGGLEVEFLDYMQFATLGLIESVERFDPSLGYAFTTYATPRIRGSILNNLEPLSEQYTQIRLRKRIAEQLDSLTADEAGTPARSRKRDLLSSLAELTVGLALSHLLEGSGMLRLQETESSYRQEFYDSEAHKQMQSTLARFVHALPEQERRVIQYHYYHGLDFTEIAKLFALSKGRISQIHRQALQLIREAHAALGHSDSFY